MIRKIMPILRFTRVFAFLYIYQTPHPKNLYPPSINPQRQKIIEPADIPTSVYAAGVCRLATHWDVSALSVPIFAHLGRRGRWVTTAGNPGRHRYCAWENLALYQGAALYR